jgi:proteic killer suppression protein
MDISYANRKIEKICTDPKVAQKELGKDGAKTLTKRLLLMRAAENLEALRFAAGDWHELTGDRKGEIACSLSGRVRLIFVPANEPLPTKPDGGLDWSNVTAVMNLEIVDYHK